MHVQMPSAAAALPSPTAAKPALVLVDAGPVVQRTVEVEERIHRPDAGLARGRYEAPIWAFWAVLTIVVLFSALYIFRVRRTRLVEARAREAAILGLAAPRVRS